MTGTSFKTMYLVSKSDLENIKRNDNTSRKNFKLSLQNRDICDGGMSVSVKPINARVRNKQKAENPTPIQLGDSDGEDGEEKFLPLPEKKVQQYPYAKLTEQSIESNPTKRNHHSSNGFRSGNQLDYINDNVDDDNENETNDPLTLVESNGQELTNIDNSTPPNIVNLNNNSNDDNEDDSIPSRIDNNDDNSNSDDEGKSDKHDPRRRKVRYGKKIKSYRLKRLQKGSKKRLRNKLFNRQETKDDTYHTEPVLNQNQNQNDNHSISQGENEDASDIQMRRVINEEHKTDEVDDNQRMSSMKKRKILDDIQKAKDDQWMGRIKSRLNDKRVQFKRKHDTIGYRINPDDISKSLIKPSDFIYLSQPESSDYLDKWKSLKELKKKPFKNKRFKPYH